MRDAVTYDALDELFCFPTRKETADSWRKLAHQCSAHYDSLRRGWVTPAAPGYAARLLQVIGSGRMSADTADEARRLNVAWATRQDALELLQKCEGDEALCAAIADGFPGVSFRTKPYHHQRHALLVALVTGRCGLFLEMGCGKTKVALDAFVAMRARGEVERMLVVCPAHLLDTWQEEAEAHTDLRVGAALPEREVLQLSGTTAVKAAQALASSSAVVVVNYAAMRAQQDSYRDLTERGRWLVVADESTRLGNPTSQQFRSVKRVADNAERVLLLTGTPFTGSLRSIYAQFLVINQGLSFGTAFGRLSALAMSLGAPVGWRGDVRWEDSKAFVGYVRGEIARHSVQWALADCVDLPARVIQDVRVTLGPEQRRIYDAVRGLVPELSGMTEDEKIVEILRLAQATAGIYNDADDGGVKFTKHNAKMDALEGLLSGDLRDVQVIVWCRFHGEMEQVGRLLDKMKIPSVEYTGRVTSKRKRSEAVRRFRSGRARVFVGSPDACGTGLTLNEAKAMVFTSLAYDYPAYLQASGRNYRIGQDQPVVVYRLIARNTVDVGIAAALRNKQRLRDLIL